MVKYCISAFLFIISIIELKGQSIGFFHEDTISVMYYPTTNSYPNKLEIAGKIVDFTQSTSCGIFMSSGTIKVKIESSSVPFEDEYIFIVVNCLAKTNNLINLSINLSLEGLTDENKDCYHPIINKFNSNGAPFYWLNSSETESFWNQVK